MNPLLSLIDTTIQKSLRSINTSQFERFHTYAKKVRSIDWADPGYTRIPLILEGISAAANLRGHLLLPKLQKITWRSIRWCSLINIQHLLLSNPRHVTLICDYNKKFIHFASDEEKDSFLAIMETIASTSNLSTLSLEGLCLLDGAMAAEVLETLCHPCSTIQKLSIDYPRTTFHPLILGQMPKLSTLEISLDTKLKVHCSSNHLDIKEEKEPFKSLSSLFVHRSSIEPTDYLLGLIRSENMHSVRILLEDASPSGLSTLLPHAYKWSKLKSLDIMQACQTPLFWPMSIIRPLYDSCPVMEELQVSGHVVDMVDEDVVAIARSWSHLRVLRLSEKARRSSLAKYPPKFTLYGLQALLNGCRTLSDLFLFMDTSTIPDTAGLQRRAGSSGTTIGISRGPNVLGLNPERWKAYLREMEEQNYHIDAAFLFEL